MSQCPLPPLRLEPHKLTNPRARSLAYKGQEGVEHCLRLLKDEIKLCMGLAGVNKVTDITKSYLVKVDRSGFTSRL